MKVFSYCLYGNDIKYLLGMCVNIEIIRNKFPDWLVFIYYRDLPAAYLTKIAKYSNVRLIPALYEGANIMFDRFMAIDDPKVSIMMVRDADSRIHERDCWAINEFIKSERGAHIIRDHPHHKFHMLGGLWGLKQGSLKFKIQDSFAKYEIANKQPQWGRDQEYLKDIIYPVINGNVLIHGSISVVETEELVAIQGEPKEGDFCGQVVFFDGEVEKKLYSYGLRDGVFKLDWTKEDIISTDKYLALDTGLEGEIAYIKTDVLQDNRSMVWRGKPHSGRAAKVWITGHSTYPISDKLFAQFQENNSIWFCLNKECADSKLVGIPLGITNDCDDTPIHKIFGNVDVMLEICALKKVDVNLAYINFTIENCAAERLECYNMFKEKNWVSMGIEDRSVTGRKMYLEEVRNHTFVFCPRGVGYDTHRLWETLYMGSIPIVKRCLALEGFADLPILFVDDWAEVNERFLIRKYEEFSAKRATWNLNKLKIGYWLEKIKEAAASAAHLAANAAET